MYAEQTSLDAAISHALLKAHMSDRVEIIVGALQSHPSAKSCSKERLDDIAVYALLEADKQGCAFDGIYIRRMIGHFLRKLDDR
jgi:hypothetical protein